jgi:hypothetical protein
MNTSIKLFYVVTSKTVFAKISNIQLRKNIDTTKEPRSLHNCTLFGLTFQKILNKCDGDGGCTKVVAGCHGLGIIVNHMQTLRIWLQ